MASTSLLSSPTSKLGSAVGVRDVDRQKRAIQLKIAGWSYAAIGKQLGVTRQRIQQMIRPSKQTIRRLRERSGGHCEKCAQPVSGHDAHVHHGRHQEDYNALNNLMWLCNSCHISEHGGRQPFTELPPGPIRLAASKAFAQPYLQHLDKRYCMACGSSGAPKGLCKVCSRKHRATYIAKSRLTTWLRGETKNANHCLNQAIYVIRKNGLTTEDFGPRK